MENTAERREEGKGTQGVRVSDSQERQFVEGGKGHLHAPGEGGGAAAAADVAG